MKTRVLTNGRIFTADKKAPWAEAVVIIGNKIAYVGSNEEALKHAQGALVEDLGGRLVTPGLIDGHLHLLAVTVFGELVHLDGMTTQEMIQAIEKDVCAHPEREAYTGMGWLDTAFGVNGPDKRDLDRICSDKPMAYFSLSMHTLWCNSKALEVAGITRDTPDIDPEGGVVYVRDENGEPTGYCKELASVSKVMASARYFDDDTIAVAMADFYKRCAELGITSIVDCGALIFMKYMFNDELCAKMDRDECPVRLNFCGFAGTTGLYEAAFESTLELSKKYNNDRFFCTFAKLFNDGTLENASAAIPHKYPNGDMIVPLMATDVLATKLEEFAKVGIDVNIHAIGSDAIHNVLEAAGIVRAKGYSDIRIICSHSSYVYPQDKEKFGKYDVFSNTTGCWIAAMSKENDEYAAELTEAEAYPVKSIMDGGARVGFGSDYPTDPASFPVMANMETLVTRRHVGEKGAFVHDEAECISIEDVITGYTINNAYQMHRENVLGSIEVGKYADLTVFEENLFEIEAGEIHNVKVAQTIKDGITTYKNK